MPEPINVLSLLTDRQREWMEKVAGHLGYSDLTRYAHYVLLNDLGWAADQTSFVREMGEDPRDWEDIADLVRGDAHEKARPFWDAARMPG